MQSWDPMLLIHDGYQQPIWLALNTSYIHSTFIWFITVSLCWFPIFKHANTWWGCWLNFGAWSFFPENGAWNGGSTITTEHSMHHYSTISYVANSCVHWLDVRWWVTRKLRPGCIPADRSNRLLWSSTVSQGTRPITGRSPFDVSMYEKNIRPFGMF